MTAIGSLRVELELNDGSFTTRVIRAGTTLQQLQTQVGQTVVAVRRLDSTFSSVAGATRDFVLTLGLLRAAAENVATVFGGLPMSILNAAGEIERLTMLISGMSQAATEAQRSLEGMAGAQWVRELSQRAPFALQTLTNAFVRLRAGGIDPMNGSLQALTDAVANFGGSSEQFDRAAVAIQQMAGKGVISLEELRQQLGEAVPNAIPLMARALGVSVDELVRQVSQGRVRAEPALRALFAEFERTFGGSAQRMMQTFRGQVQLLETNWLNFRVAAGGQPGSGGFLDSATEGVRRLNAALSSPDGLGAAIRLGQVFRDITDGVISFAETLVRYRSEIGTALQLGALLIGVRLLTTAFQTLGAAMNALMLMTFGRNILAASSLAAGLNAVTLAAIGAGTALQASFAAAALRAAAAMAALNLSLAASFGSLAAASASFASFGSALAPAMARFGAWMAAGTMAVVGFKAVLVTAAAVVVGGALISALSTLGQAWSNFGSNVQNASEGFMGWMTRMAQSAGESLPRIGNALEYLGTRFMRLFSDSQAGIERLRFGATDSGTLGEVKAQIDLLSEGLLRAQGNLELLRQADQRFRSDPSGYRRNPANIQPQDGAGLIDGVSGGYVRDQLIGQRQQDIQRYMTAARAQVQELTELVNAAERSRIEQLARAWADAQISSIETAMRDVRGSYESMASDLATARQAIENNDLLGREERNRQLGEIQRSNLENQQRLYQEQIRRFDGVLTAARQSYAAAAQAGNDQEVARYASFIQKLEGLSAQARQRASEIGTTLADTLTNGRSPEQLDREAQTALRNMEARVQELRAETGGLGGELARINFLIASGRWGDVGEEMAQKMRDAAVAVDDANRSLEEQRRIRQALNQLDTNVDRAATSLQTYSNVLRTGAMSEAQRSFIRFQEEMNTRLREFASLSGTTAEQIADAASKVNQAVQTAQLGSIINQVNDFVQQADRARLQNLTPNERLAEELRIRGEIITTLRQQIDLAISAAEATILAAGGGVEEAQAELATLQLARTRLLQAQTTLDDNSGRRAARAGGSGTENMLTRMTARLAEMRAEIETGTGEYAKLLAQLQRTGQVGSAAGQQALAIARQLDEMSVNADRARAAWGALTEVIRQGAQGQGAAVESLTQIGGGALAEPRQILQAIGRIRGAVSELQSVNANPEEIARAEERAQQALAGVRSRYAADQAVQYADQTRQIREGLANTLSERRQAMLEEIRLEEERYRRTVELSALSDAQKRQALEVFESYAAARRDQALRDTENALERTMREWSKLTDNTFEVLASGIDKLADGLLEFALTGKANFADMAKSILADLAKIQLRAAISGLFQMVTGSFGGGGGGLLGGLLGGGGGTAPIVKTAGLHSGGIVGLEQTFSRALSGLPKFHTGGLASDEQLAILQKGEGVFTEGQMAVIGRMNRSYGFVESALSAMMKAIPSSAAPSMPDPSGAPRSGTGAMPGVKINLINQSNQPVEAMADQPYMDMEGMVVDVVIRNAARPGPLRDLIRGGGA